jgi:hypothetical protein
MVGFISNACCNYAEVTSGVIVFIYVVGAVRVFAFASAVLNLSNLLVLYFAASFVLFCFPA